MCALVVASTNLQGWTAILVALGGGGIIGTLVTLSHERGAEMRTRMLETADRHLAGVAELGHAARELRLVLPDEIPDADDLERRFARLQNARDELLANLFRIQLLFGNRSATWRAAIELDRWIEGVVDVFDEWGRREPGSPPPAPRRREPNIEGFARAARRDVRFGIGARLFERVRH